MNDVVVLSLSDGDPVVIMSLVGTDPSKPSLLLNSHMDVVPGKNSTARAALTRPSEANDASFSDFFIFHFLTTFSFFHSLPLLPYRPFSFLLVPPSFSSLLLPRPALSKSCNIRKSPFFINFDESITDGPTDQPTDRRTRPLLEMRTHLKTFSSHVTRVAEAEAEAPGSGTF